MKKGYGNSKRRRTSYWKGKCFFVPKEKALVKKNLRRKKKDLGQTDGNLSLRRAWAPSELLQKGKGNYPYHALQGNSREPREARHLEVSPVH